MGQSDQRLCNSCSHENNAKQLSKDALLLRHPILTGAISTVIVVLLQEEGLTYVVGMTQARSNARVNIAKKYLVHEPFLFLVHNFTSHPDLAFGIPLDKLAVVGLPYYLE